MSDNLKFSIERLSEHKAISVMRTGPYDESAPQAWQDLWAFVGHHGLENQVRRIIGFGLDDPAITPAHDLRYRANLVLHDFAQVEENDDGIIITLPGGAYAVHRMMGAYKTMPDKFQRFRDTIDAAGLLIDATRPFLEIYVNSPDTALEDELITDLCIPITS